MSRKNRLVWASLFFLSVPGAIVHTAAGGGSPKDDLTKPAGAARQAPGLPLGFEACRGSRDEAALCAQGAGFRLVLAPGGRMRVLTRGGASFTLAPQGAFPIKPSPEAAPAGRRHYLLGDDPSEWRRNVPVYRRARYRNLYAGIDLAVYGAPGGFEYDFVVRPGADPSQIAVAMQDAELMRDSPGRLVIRSGEAEFHQEKPVAYQWDSEKREPVEAGYELAADDTVRFALGPYDPQETLVIDPVLTYSTFLGGSLDEQGKAIAVDREGAVYVAGSTRSEDFPLSGASQNGLNGSREDAFVAKLSPDGSALLFATYLGGRGADIAQAVAVDRDGNIYVAGETQSEDFPAAGGLRGGSDAFIVKLSSEGEILFSRFLGGGAADRAFGVAVDPGGNAYVAGETFSDDFPATAGALQPNFNRGLTDAFVTKFDPDGRVVYSTYLGGSESERAAGVAVEPAGAAVVAGTTISPDFPATPGVLQPELAGFEDAFVARLNPEGSALEFSTFLGGAGSDQALGVDRGPQGAVHLCGATDSLDFPATRGAAQIFLNGRSDGFAAKLEPGGRALIHATYLGGINDDSCQGVAADPAGASYAAGVASRGFPVTEDASQPSFRGGFRDGFLVKLASGGGLLFGTFLGGTAPDSAYAVAADAGGSGYVIGGTASGNFPAVEALQPGSGGGGDAFVTKFFDVAARTVSAASFRGEALAPASIVTTFARGLANSTQAAASNPLPQEIAGTSVTVTDRRGEERPAELFFVSPRQINFLIPAATAGGEARIHIQRPDGFRSTELVRIERVAPGIFTANANGEGVAAANILRVRQDGSRATGMAARFDSEAGVFRPRAIELSPGVDVFLSLFGTGIRGGASEVEVTAGGVSLPVLFAGEQGRFAGLDQINVGPVPEELSRAGEVPVIVRVAGREANPITVAFD